MLKLVRNKNHINTDDLLLIFLGQGHNHAGVQLGVQWFVPRPT